ncbi:HCNGP-like protein-domain-containing protein [Aspergillus spinulosporus]
MMLGLGNYESSSEDEVEKEQSLPESKQDLKKSHVESSQTLEDKTQHRPKDASAVRDTVPDRELSGPILGPMHDMGPSHTSDGQPLSNRTLIHDLTLPPVPNLDIPPSPPGSPNPAANAKFEHFLSLKKQGIHFNDKLANSVSLKNPSLLSQMMQHAGIDDRAQYSTSLPTEMWNTLDLPSWGYKEELLKAQRELNVKAEETRAKGQRDTIEFVSDTSRPYSASHSKLKPR